MKKTYLTPAVEEIRIHTMKMLAESLALDSNTEITNNSEILTREADSDWGAYDGDE